MQISFIVSLFNQLPLTQACYSSLLQALPAGLAHEIILIDDASTDGTREWLQTLRLPADTVTRVLLNERNVGYAASNNRAARQARGDIFFLLNSDLELLPGWFEPMLTALDSRTDAALVGNVQRTPDGAIHHTGVYINARGKPEHDHHAPSHGGRTPSSATDRAIRDVVITTAACALVRRDTFTQLGGFDESFRNGHEDVDLCLRARAAGLRNYVALDSSVVHHVSASRGRDRTNIANSARSMNRWRAILPDLAGEAWRDPHLRPAWERRLSFFPRLRAALSRPPAGTRPPAFPAWLRTSVAHRIEIQLARWRRELGGTLPQ